MQSRAAGVVRRKIASWRLWFKVPVFVRRSGIKNCLRPSLLLTRVIIFASLQCRKPSKQIDRQYAKCFLFAMLVPNGALNTVAIEKDMLRHLLLPRPKKWSENL